MPDSNPLATEFENLFRENYSPLFYYALDWVEKEEVAKDLVSELFCDIWNDFAAHRDKNLKAYLYSALRNRCLNYLRHLVVEQEYQRQMLRQKADIIGDDPKEHEEQLKIIDNIIESLTPRTRLIFVQCYLEGHSYKEVAAMLDISVAAVHKHVSAAFSKFREVFKVKKK